jgi:hypothetical protein
MSRSIGSTSNRIGLPITFARSSAPPRGRQLEFSNDSLTLEAGASVCHAV